MKAVVIGLGEIGTAVTEAMLANSRDIAICGVDVDEAAKRRWVSRFGETHSDRISVSGTIPWDGDWYSVCVMSQGAIIKVVDEIVRRSTSEPFVAVESTMGRPTADALYGSGVLAFPHRYNPGDEHHHVFNLPRLIGGDGAMMASRWLERVFGYREAIATSFHEAAMTKLVENAYRAMEIILAQELKVSVEDKAMKFDTVRFLANTKWNIDIKEARDGVKGKCLPKDLDLFIEAFPSHSLAKIMRGLNMDYIARHG